MVPSRVSVLHLQQLARRSPPLLALASYRGAASLAVPIGAALGAALGAAVPLARWLSRETPVDETPIECVARAGRLLTSADGRARAAAWARLRSVLETDDSARSSLGAMMEAIGASAVEGSEAQRALLDEALSAGVRPCSAVLNVMLAQLQVEGHDRPALEKLQVELRAHGAVADAVTGAVLAREGEALKLARTRELHRVLTLPRSASGAEESAAWAIFERLLARNQVRPAHLRVMLTRAAGDESADAQLALIARVREASAGRVRANVHLYTAVLTRIQLEGGGEEAVGALLAQMQREGVVPDARMEAALARPAAEVSKMRTRKLLELLERATPDGTAHAHRLFDSLLERRAADGYQLGAMLSHGTASVVEMRALLSRAEASGCALPVAAFNALLSRLQIEGQPIEALGKVLAEMKRQRLEPDTHTRRILRLTDTALSAMRTRELRRRLLAGEDGSRAAAWDLFGGLVERGQHDAFQLNAMRAAATALAGSSSSSSSGSTAALADADEEGAQQQHLQQHQQHVAIFRRAEEQLRSREQQVAVDNGG